ncbi:NAD(P)H-dependent glycerol-3-phosphate dehydrogenase [Psychrobacter sp. F1192]|uniref:Glycerol-3-phosphate dehydrogenase [NAD(P)+] n=1 Tax=Psychrobacter coccoides TaxID=2818440 RepID=A0ABS3NK08_9GAMM|nr:NAD(P)H-dependent glycerol-3-phosphate dehydrogenase [Psychrobacter coccoides]MBO1529735.1 NAD(P)H-dependent glycerol-3-phosphate dehydrogenase [Psychrobacter coccoides]
MTSANKDNTANHSTGDFTDKTTAQTEHKPDISNNEKPSGLLAGIIERATKSGVGRRKLDPSIVESDVEKNMQKIRDNPTKLRLAFLGGGSFGTAMANLAARNGCDVTLWVRNKRTVKAMTKTQTNKKYLPGYKLDDRLKYSHDLAATVKNKDIIFLAVPSSAFRETLKNIAPFITGQSVVSLTKGMEKDTFALMSDIIKDELPEVNFGVMSGPNLAIEIMKNMPSATVIASDSEPLRHAVQAALHSAFFRVFASDDVKGVELGGALKNIYAIAMGMAAAYDVGENTKAMLLTRALAEMSRFGVETGANPLTFLGLSGVGDLYATCSSELSRNFRIGNMLGSGMSIDAAVKKLGQTAEGVNTIQQVHEKATKEGIYMPITHALYAVIYEDKAALGVALHLMEAGFRSDVEFVMPHDHSNAELTAQIQAATSDTDDDNATKGSGE